MRRATVLRCDTLRVTNLTRRQLNFHCGAIQALLLDDSVLSPFRTVRTHRQTFSNRNAHVFRHGIQLVFHGTDVFPTSRLCNFRLLLLSTLTAPTVMTLTHTLCWEAPQPFTANCSFFIAALRCLLPLFPELGHVLFVFGPSVCIGQAH